MTRTSCPTRSCAPVSRAANGRTSAAPGAASSLLRSLSLCLFPALLSACGGGSSAAGQTTTIGTVSSTGGANQSASTEPPPAAASAPTPAPSVATPAFVDRLDFGAADAERAHGLNVTTTAAAVGTAASGAGGHSYRQLKLVKYATTPTPADTLSFTLAVDPARQNYLTVKLWGSDTQFGVLHLLGLTGTAGEPVFDQLDNNISNSASNPPFHGRFHYATTLLPLSMTAGKTAVALSLYSTGYYYDAGGDRAGNPTRPVYSAFTHTDPYFVPPAGETVGAAPLQVGTAPPNAVDKSAVYRVLKRSRANMYNLDGVPDGFWNPGGTVAHDASVIPAGTPGAPPEVIGMHMWEGPVTPAQIAALNAQADPASAWRNAVVGRQAGAVAIVTTAYLTPPLKDIAGNVVPGYDRYLNPAMLDRLIGLMDGQARSEGGSATALTGWDNSCYALGWGGVTSAPRASGTWAGSRGRQNGGCITFSNQWASICRTVLRIYDDPQAAAAFNARLAERIDADLDGRTTTRAAMYQRMFAASAGGLGFGLKALTSTDLFDKFGGTAAQAMIWVGEVYHAQLALRGLLAAFPTGDADKQPMDPTTLRIIVRQLLGLDDMVFMAPATPGWRIITRGGLSETYGSLSAGYDGRYGGGIPPLAATFALLTRYDTAMTGADRAEASNVVRNLIAAFDNFLYPQHQISTRQDGSVVDTYALGQEDVISWRVPYGPNANGWNLNMSTIAVDPAGSIQSPLARRAFLLNAGRSGADSLITDMSDYTASEAAWLSIAGVDPASVPLLPGEPGAADFTWADVDSGAFALHVGGERLFFNANYNRGKGAVNQVVRLHHVTDLVDRQATVRMPFDPATVQDDGNLSGGFDGAWVVRYGRYLVVMNRGARPVVASTPAGSGSARVVNTGATVTMGATFVVPAGGYAAVVLP